MSLALLLALQAAPPPPPATGPLAIEFDLARVKPSDPCRTGGAGSEITVCGRRPRDYSDMEKWAQEFRTLPLIAETSIGPGAVVRAYGESAGMPGGQISKRAMVGVRLRF